MSEDKLKAEMKDFMEKVFALASQTTLDARELYLCFKASAMVFEEKEPLIKGIAEKFVSEAIHAAAADKNEGN